MRIVRGRRSLLPLFSAILFLLMQFPFTAKAANFCDSGCMHLLQTKLDNYRQSNHIPGMSMTVSVGKNRLLNFYSGNVENLAVNANAAKVDANSLFEIGSITKSFIAAVILQLDAERRLNLTDKVNHWLPEIKDPNWGNVTVKQLLNMTSGIPDYVSADFFAAKVIKNPRKFWPTEDLLNVVYPQMDFIPGSSWHYSNTGYLLAGEIIEQVTGKSVATNFAERIFQPLHLTASSVVYEPNLVPNQLQHMVHGYTELNDEKFHSDAAQINTSVYGAAGGIITTAENVAIWIKSLFGGKVLPVTQFNKMTEMVCIDSGWLLHKCKAGQRLPNNTNLVGYALGLGRYPAKNHLGPVWNYFGSTPGYFSVWYYVDPPLAGQMQSHDFLITFCADVDPTSSTEKSLKNLLREIYSYFYPT